MLSTKQIITLQALFFLPILNIEYGQDSLFYPIKYTAFDVTDHQELFFP